MMKNVIQWAGERGLYVIFDYFAMKNTEGKQSGQETLPWPPYNRHPEVVGSRAEFIEIWKSVARELGPFPNVLFELYNEPNGDEKAETEWFSFCQEAIAAIRAGVKNPIIVQWDLPTDWPVPIQVWCSVGETRGQRLDGLGCQAGFRFVSDGQASGFLLALGQQMVSKGQRVCCCRRALPMQ
jgi:aryl-phospho-beta-D-glucosidase BglC (GH1 family)